MKMRKLSKGLKIETKRNFQQKPNPVLYCKLFEINDKKMKKSKIHSIYIP